MITIYLANLTHISKDGYIASEFIPLNIGYLASYVKENLGAEVEIELFNLPSKLEDAFRLKVPDILGCSNYSWNSSLNYFYLSQYKDKYPQMVTVMGGPEYPGSKHLQIKFLEEKDRIDFYIFREGEIPFLKLIKRLIEAKLNLSEAKQKAIPGCHFLRDGNFVGMEDGERVKNLDDIPSPYLKGMFDELLEKGFVPIIQTNRGCPFCCAYCLSNAKYYNKTSKFSKKHTFKELVKVAKHAKTQVLYITNDNFGIFDEDLDYAGKLSECIRKYNWPQKILVSTSKVRRENVKNCLLSLGGAIYYTASVQSQNADTLYAVKRKNFTFQEQRDILKELRENGVKASCEIILGLPKETKESHLAVIKDAVDAGIEFVGFYTCMLLKNTPLAEDPEYNQYEMIRKYRILCRDFGIYLDKGVMEIEEVSVGSKDLCFDDYIFLRGFHFIVTCFYNMEIFNELVHYLRYLNISVFDWLIKLHERLIKDKGKPGRIYREFVGDAKFELWDSREEILSYYARAKNFQKLLDGRYGANLLQKYTVIFLDNLAVFINLCEDVMLSNFHEVNSLAVKELLKFSRYCKGNLFDASVLYNRRSFHFDIPKWVECGMKSNLEDFSGRININFFHNEQQQSIINNYLKLYGTKQDSRGKLLTRVNFYSLYRDFDYSK